MIGNPAAQKGFIVNIEFRRTGERRYAVIVRKPGQEPLESSPAPGYDPLMPHDLLHYALERELDLRTGIFGQLSRGGGAKTFHVNPGAATRKREVSHQRRQLAKRDARWLHAGRRDSALSEQAVYVCRQLWDGQRRAAARHGVVDAQVVAESGIAAPRLTRVCARLGELSQQWKKLRIGESMSVVWPDRA